MSENWYYTRNGQRFGPFPAEKLRELAAARQLTPADLVWKDGLPGWVAAGGVAGLLKPDPLDKEKTTVGAAAPRTSSVNAVLDNEKTTVGAAPAAQAADVLDSAKTTVGAGPEARISSAETPPPEATPAQAPSAAPARGWKVDQLIDKYRITKTLGRGGMGVVYKVTNLETENECALKVLAPELVADPQMLLVLRKEFATAEALAHQNLLKVNALHAAGNVAYIVMEYVDGANLEEYRRLKGGTISPDEFRKLAPQVLLGLEYLHEKGVIHRDVKPQNIMLTKAGEVKITDYGIAQTIKEQMLQRQHAQLPAGTLHYMAPETLEGAAADRRADVYSTGMMFYRLLTGRFPFDEAKREDIVKWHLDPKHKLGKVAIEGVGDVLHKALSVDPAARYSSCKEFLQALAKVGAVDKIYDEAPPEETKVGDWVLPPTTQKTDLRAAGAIVGGALAAGLVLFLFAYLFIWGVDWINTGGSWALYFVQWMVKAAAISVFTALLAPAAVVVGKFRSPKVNELTAIGLGGLVGGFVLALILSWLVGGVVSGVVFSLMLGCAAAGAMLAVRKRWPFALGGGGAAFFCFLLLIVLMFVGGGGAADNPTAKRLVGKWVNGSNTLDFTDNGSVVLDNSDKVAQFSASPRQLRIDDKGSLGGTITYDLDMASNDKFILGPSDHTWGTAFGSLSGTWQRAESKGASGSPSPTDNSGAKRLVGNWQKVAEGFRSPPTLDFTENGSIVHREFGEEVGQFTASTNQLRISERSRSGSAYTYDLDLVSDDQFILGPSSNDSGAFGSLKGTWQRAGGKGSLKDLPGAPPGKP